jgi:DNA-binding transcriptional ArsR family regulator
LVSHSSKQLNEKEQSNNDFPLLPQIDALNSKVRVEIFFLLNIFGELNLTELSSMMNKSKPALHRHLQIMLEAGIIKESKEEKVRGSIKAKFYKLEIDLLNIQINREQLLEVEDDKLRTENVKKIIQLERSKYLITRAYLDYIDRYLDQLEELLCVPPDKIDWDFFTKDEFLLKGQDFRVDVNLLSEETHTLMKNYNLEFVQKANTINTEYQREHGKKPIEETLVVLTTIPILKLMEFHKKTFSPKKVQKNG